MVANGNARRVRNVMHRKVRGADLAPRAQHTFKIG